MGGVAEFRRWARTHCDVARLLGARMGLPPPVEAALQHLYERWDGKGMPGEVRGGDVPLAVRLMQVAQDADMGSQQGGPAAAGPTLARRAGSGLDPRAVSAFLALGDAVYEGLDAPSIWDEAMLGEPGPQPAVDEERLDGCLSAVADFADLKSTWTTGHSRGVAALAGQAGAAAGLPECEVLALLARGMATKQVARELGISPKTCDHHIQAVYAKIGVSSRAGATLFALEHGLASLAVPGPA